MVVKLLPVVPGKMTRGRDSVSVVTFITMGIASGRGPGGQAGTEGDEYGLARKRYPIIVVYREQVLVDSGAPPKIRFPSFRRAIVTVQCAIFHYRESSGAPFNAEKRRGTIGLYDSANGFVTQCTPSRVTCVTILL